MEKQVLWTERVRVKSYEVDASGRLSFRALFNLFQEVAGQHATHLGVGFEALRQHDLFWVLSRIRVDIVRMPAWREDIAIATWPKGVERLFALRDFRMLDRDGALLVNGSTGWLLLDSIRYRPKSIGTLPERVPLNAHEHAIGAPLEKIIPPAGLAPVGEVLVRYSDLDVNNHVNNARYPEWIIDACAADGHERSISSLQINYLEEAREGDTIGLLAGPLAGAADTTYAEGISRNRDAKIFQSRFTWQPAVSRDA